MQSSSEIFAILSFEATSIHNFPIRTTGQLFLHSCRHLFGLHLSELTMAILVCLSVSSVALFGGILIVIQWTKKDKKSTDSGSICFQKLTVFKDFCLHTRSPSPCVVDCMQKPAGAAGCSMLSVLSIPSALIWGQIVRFSTAGWLYVRKRNGWQTPFVYIFLHNDPFVCQVKESSQLGVFDWHEEGDNLLSNLSIIKLIGI